MKSKVLYFPRDVEVRITPKSVVTDEFRQKIRDSFRDYTYGTREDYRYQDKLAYINLIRMATHYAGTIAKINEAARGIKNSQSDTAVIDWLNQAFDTLAQARRQADDDMRSVLLDIKVMSTRLAKNGHKNCKG